MYKKQNGCKWATFAGKNIPQKRSKPEDLGSASKQAKPSLGQR